jgi:alkyl sulfatase BDS1-like metallo-beta-lactamase superfamily hydrolase
MVASHSWPRWGNERIQEVMRAQRDTNAHLSNGVLHLANQGATITLNRSDLEGAMTGEVPLADFAQEDLADTAGG